MVTHVAVELGLGDEVLCRNIRAGVPGSSDVPVGAVLEGIRGRRGRGLDGELRGAKADEGREGDAEVEGRSHLRDY